MNKLRLVWADISKQGVEREMPLYERRQVQLINQGSVLVFALSICDLLFNTVQGRLNPIWGDLLLIPVMAAIPLLNARKWYRGARLFVGFTLQVSLVISILLEWQTITIGIYLQHLLFMILVSTSPILLTNLYEEPWEFGLTMLIHCFMIIFVIGLPYVNAYYNPVRVPDGDFDLILMAILFIWILLSFLMWFFKGGYLAYNDKLIEVRKAGDLAQDQIDELSERAAHLERSIRQMESSFATRLDKRTRKLEEDNRRLREYAMLNAQMVRGPLARIKGLSHLLELYANQMPENTDPEVVNRLKESATELEGMMGRIKAVIGEDDDATSFPWE